jgi:predicted polyphosphate/ATP-dependent NAD kinase
MNTRIGFIINPIAGMGGRVGLKGTDGVFDVAVKRGAEPIAFDRALQCIKSFKKLESSSDSVEWFTCGGDMGSSVLDAAEISHYEIIYQPENRQTKSKDTKKACEVFLKKNIDILVFCGGDGTARDIVSVVNEAIPIL